MMKKYTAPETKITVLSSEDIITASAGYGDTANFLSLVFNDGDIDFTQEW